jgi:hypothetical protein
MSDEINKSTEVIPVEAPASEVPVEVTPTVESPVSEVPVFSPPVKGEGGFINTPPVEAPIEIIPVAETPTIETRVESIPDVEISELKVPVVESPVVSSPPAKGEMQRGSIDMSEGQRRSISIPEEPSVSSLDRISLSFKENMLRAKERLLLANKAIQLKRQKQLDKLIKLFSKKTKVKNKDVRGYLNVPDDTATTYLNILKKEGKIKKEGKSKKDTFYTKL